MCIYQIVARVGAYRNAPYEAPALRWAPRSVGVADHMESYRIRPNLTTGARNACPYGCFATPPAAEASRVISLNPRARGDRPVKGYNSGRQLRKAVSLSKSPPPDQEAETYSEPPGGPRVRAAMVCVRKVSMAGSRNHPVGFSAGVSRVGPRATFL